jgi:hypothetical protein
MAAWRRDALPRCRSSWIDMLRTPSHVPGSSVVQDRREPTVPLLNSLIATLGMSNGNMRLAGSPGCERQGARKRGIPLRIRVRRAGTTGKHGLITTVGFIGLRGCLLSDGRCDAACLRPPGGDPRIDIGCSLWSGVMPGRRREGGDTQGAGPAKHSDSHRVLLGRHEERGGETPTTRQCGGSSDG